MSSPSPQFRSRMPRIAEAAVERVRLTVVPRARTRAPRLPFVTLVTMVLLGGVVGLLLFNTSMQQASFAATSLQDQATGLGLREQTLAMELDQLRDPQRVALRAQRLGMVPAGAPAFLDLASGKVLGTAAPADSQQFRILPYPAVKPAALNPPPRIVTVQGVEQDNSSGDTGAASPEGQGQTGRTD